MTGFVPSQTELPARTNANKQRIDSANEKFAKGIAHFFASTTRNVSQHARNYVAGLLSRCPRKN